MLESITPVLLTYNEQENIGRTLSRLVWANAIVVVDSGSTDETLAELAKYPKVRVFKRAFDTHANQWRYAVENTNIETPWIFRLDADYQVGDALILELAQLTPDESVCAYRIGFDYAVFSHKLRNSLYPANTILLRRGHFSVRDKGHTEVWEVAGKIENLRARVTHDDWKSTKQWLVGQSRYMQLEFDALQQRESGLVRWLRVHPPLMPIAVFFYCLFVKRLISDGRPGMLYAMQRMISEAILSLLVLEHRLRTGATLLPGKKETQHKKDGNKGLVRLDR